MAGPSGPISGGGHIPFSAEWLRKAADAAKKQATGKTQAEEASESYKPSDAAKGLAVTKDEKMLQTMKAELSKLDPESESFMEEATGALIDSVIDQEYGEGLKGKSGYGNLKDKLIETVMNSEAFEEVADFFELLLLAQDIREPEEDAKDEQGETDDEDDEEDVDTDDAYEED